MAFSAREAGSASDNPVPGTKGGRLVGLVDLGEQPPFEHNGKHIESKYKVRFIFELGTSLTEEGRPHWVAKDVNSSNWKGKAGSNPSGMMKIVKALDPTYERSNSGRNLEKLIGTPCMIQVGLSDSGYPTIENVSGAPEEMAVPELANPPLVFLMDNPDMAQWDRLPEFIQNRIKDALNFDETALSSKLMDRANSTSEGDY